MWPCPTSRCRSAAGRWNPAERRSLRREHWTFPWQTGAGANAARCWIVPRLPKTNALRCGRHDNLVSGNQWVICVRGFNTDKPMCFHRCIHTPPLYSVLLLQSPRSISTVPAITNSSSRASKTDTSLESTTWDRERDKRRPIVRCVCVCKVVMDDSFGNFLRCRFQYRY